MMLWHGLIDPFLSFGFMRRALMACLALSLSAAPLGVFLLLRRMSLVGMPCPTRCCRAQRSAI